LKVLITGAQGQVGRCLLASLPPGVTAIGLTRTDLDVGDADAVSRTVAAHTPAVIINAAAYTAVDRAHISTDFVFDGRAGSPYAPDAPTAPLGTYGLTKLEGEQAVAELAADTSVVLRTAWVYAAHGANFLRTMLRIMAEKGQVRVVADQIGTPTAADSLAGVLWGLAQRPDISGVHHFTDAGVASWYDFAVAIAEEGAAIGLLPAGVRVTAIGTADYPTPARRPGYSVLDKRSLLAALSPQHHHWRVGLRRVLGTLAATPKDR